MSAIIKAKEIGGFIISN